MKYLIYRYLIRIAQQEGIMTLDPTIETIDKLTGFLEIRKDN